MCVCVYAREREARMDEVSAATKHAQEKAAQVLSFHRVLEVKKNDKGIARNINPTSE